MQLAPGSQLGIGSPSPVSMQMQAQMQPTQLLSQQAQQLLEEAQAENRMLEDTVATLKEQVCNKITINFKGILGFLDLQKSEL